MQISLTIDFEVADEYAEFMDRSGSWTTAQYFTGVVQTALSNALGDFPGVVTDLKVHADTSGQRDTTRNSVPEFRNPVVVASAPRTTNGQTVRNGRPKTLRDMEASDGLPVREYGDRSPESLHAAGISTRFANSTDQWVPERPERKRAAQVNLSKEPGHKSQPVPKPGSKRASFPVRSR